MFSLDFPARAGYVSTARIFAAAVARQFGCGADDIEDLKLALSEACGRALAPGDPDASLPIRLRITPGNDKVVFEMEGPGPADFDGSATGEHMLALGEELIYALFPEVEYSETREGTRFKISVPVPSPAR